jgi:hypothetical protein
MRQLGTILFFWALILAPIVGHAQSADSQANRNLSVVKAAQEPQTIGFFCAGALGLISILRIRRTRI